MHRSVGKQKRKAKAKVKANETMGKENPKVRTEEEARARVRTDPKEGATCVKEITSPVTALKQGKVTETLFTLSALSR